MSDLVDIARRAMAERGLLTEFTPEEMNEADSIAGPAQPDENTRDLRHMLWCSIDNDDSMDLDQLSVADPQPDGSVRLLIAVADVDALVPMGSLLDRHAQQNTATVYTASHIFPMLPERLSTDLTSLGPQDDRVALIIEYTFSSDGSLSGGDVYLGWVNNRAKLAYDSVGAWLEGDGELPAPAAAVAGMDEQLRIQDKAAQQLRELRHEHGALDLETVQAQPVYGPDGTIVDMKAARPNRAKQLIEDLMVAANGVTARYLIDHGYPSLRRVVRAPERWDRIVKYAEQFGAHLPDQPDSKSLEQFLVQRRAADPDHYPDVSLAVVKMMGPGEYAVEVPGQEGEGHFGLAVRDYAHSTAPNRRYPDLITHRLLKASMRGHEPPYSVDELNMLASHCTEREDAANKVERQVRKSAAAMVLGKHIGDIYDGIVTGVTKHGLFVRTQRPPADGILHVGQHKVDVGDKVRCRLLSVNVDRGFIDFALV